MRTLITPILATAGLALGVSACGGTSHAAAPASTQRATATSAAAASGPGSKLSLSAPSSGALMFNTTTLKARAGTVTITFVNHSSVGHDVTVIHGTSGGEVGATPVFDHGSRTLTLHLTAGRYTYFCSVPGHRQAGMQGTLTVT